MTAICGHRLYGSTTHCAEMSCSNYVRKGRSGIQLLADHMRVGTRYRVTFQIAGVQRKPRTMVATYIGVNEQLTELQFSLRPEAGTTSLGDDSIIKVEAVGSDVRVQAPTD